MRDEVRIPGKDIYGLGGILGQVVKLAAGKDEFPGALTDSAPCGVGRTHDHGLTDGPAEFLTAERGQDIVAIGPCFGRKVDPHQRRGGSHEVGQADDLVYLNGTEAKRANLPEGEIAYETLAEVTESLTMEGGNPIINEYYGGWQERSWDLYAAAEALGGKAPDAAEKAKFFGAAGGK